MSADLILGLGMQLQGNWAPLHSHVKKPQTEHGGKDGNAAEHLSFSSSDMKRQIFNKS